MPGLASVETNSPERFLAMTPWLFRQCHVLPALSASPRLDPSVISIKKRHTLPFRAFHPTIFHIAPLTYPSYSSGGLRPEERITRVGHCRGFM